LSIDPITVTYPEASRLSGFGLTKLAQFVREGRVKSVKIDHRRLIDFASLKALLTGAPDGAAPSTESHP
jgi:hypothetical protein